MRASAYARLETSLSKMGCDECGSRSYPFDVMSSPTTHTSLSRRQALGTIFGFALGAVASLEGCRDPGGVAAVPGLPSETSTEPLPARAPYADNVDALYDVLIPAELDALGKVSSPGAREVGADKVLRLATFVPLAVAQGLLPSLTEAEVSALGDLQGPFRATLNAGLDVLAVAQKPLTAFRDLPRALQEKVVAAAFADSVQRVPLLVVRAACFTAYLGAPFSDAGLRAIGYPPFENLADGLAVSGYPRTRAGRLIEASKENLVQLAASGDLDDYTYNRTPAPTTGDDLGLVIDANGDLV